MYLRNFKHQGVRNLKSGKLELGQYLNVFYGNNGAGKSSVLEAIGFLTSGRSFRTNKLELVVNEKESEFFVFGQTDDSQTMGIQYQKSSKSKLIKVNSEKAKNLSSLSKLYPTQVLSPESYHLIDSGPGERRKYLDWCLFHVKHSYHQAWKRYSVILKQRNALLKKLSFAQLSQQIASWDKLLIEAANEVNRERTEVSIQLQNLLKDTVNILDVEFCDSLKLSYYPGFTGDLAEKLQSSLQSDCDSGVTKFGPHKADLRIKVNGYLARDFLSRGQKKLLINAMYFAQTLLLKSMTAKNSLFIIDDFSSELDYDNQKVLLTMLLAQDNVQIILSCLQQDSLKWLEKGYNNAHMFHVEHGTVTSM